jgi:hypothetical protein
MPSLQTSAETLTAMREAMADWQLPAPAAPDVLREEDGVSTELHVYPGAPHGLTTWGPQTETGMLEMRFNYSQDYWRTGSCKEDQGTVIRICSLKRVITTPESLSPHTTKHAQAIHEQNRALCCNKFCLWPVYSQSATLTTTCWLTLSAKVYRWR